MAGDDDNRHRSFFQNKMPPPDHLYKYESFSTQSLLNLKKQVIYFGSPASFNDPYDCALTPNIVEPTDEEALLVRNEYLKKHDIPRDARAAFETAPVSDLKVALLRAAHSAFDLTITEFLQKRGVSCFSERNDDLLMWSHYGGKYRGFCLEFETTSEAFQRVQQVRYAPEIPPLTITQVLLNENFHPFLELFCTKSNAWEYEREWRAIHVSAGTQFEYPASTLTGVYFGPDIDRQSLEIICLILAGQNDSVQLWQGRRSSTEFRVLFEPFIYTSNLEAKRRGLPA